MSAVVVRKVVVSVVNQGLICLWLLHLDQYIGQPSKIVFYGSPNGAPLLDSENTSPSNIINVKKSLFRLVSRGIDCLGCR